MWFSFSYTIIIYGSSCYKCHYFQVIKWVAIIFVNIVTHFLLYRPWKPTQPKNTLKPLKLSKPEVRPLKKPKPSKLMPNFGSLLNKNPPSFKQKFNFKLKKRPSVFKTHLQVRSPCAAAMSCVKSKGLWVSE